MGPPGRLQLAAVLALGVLSLGVASPLIRLCQQAGVPDLAIAAWRMTLAAGLTGALWLIRGSPAAAGGIGPRRERLLLLLSGLLLAAHFATWIVSLGLTSVAASVVLVNTMPLFAVLLSLLFLAERVAGRQLAGIALACVGAGAIALDRRGGGSALAGNLLALAGAATAAGYYVIGRALRPGRGLWAYVTPVYGTAAAALLAACLVGGVPLFASGPQEWLLFALLALVPTLGGHTVLNWTLRWLPAPVVNVAALGEPIVAAALAALLPAIAEVPGPWTIAGGVVALAGIGVVLRRRAGG